MFDAFINVDSALSISFLKIGKTIVSAAYDLMIFFLKLQLSFAHFHWLVKRKKETIRFA